MKSHRYFAQNKENFLGCPLNPSYAADEQKGLKSGGTFLLKNKHYDKQLCDYGIVGWIIRKNNNQQIQMIEMQTLPNKQIMGEKKLIEKWA